MKVTVCELGHNWTTTEDTWTLLREHLYAEDSELLLLPEMPFYRWLSGDRQADVDQWRRAIAAHDQWINRFEQLPVAMVLGTRPTMIDGQHHNEGFIWHHRLGSDSRKFFHAPNLVRDSTLFARISLGVLFDKTRYSRRPGTRSHRPRRPSTLRADPPMNVHRRPGPNAGMD